MCTGGPNVRQAIGRAAYSSQRPVAPSRTGHGSAAKRAQNASTASSSSFSTADDPGNAGANPLRLRPGPPDDGGRPLGRARGQLGEAPPEPARVEHVDREGTVAAAGAAAPEVEPVRERPLRLRQCLVHRCQQGAILVFFAWQRIVGERHHQGEVISSRARIG